MTTSGALAAPSPLDTDGSLPAKPHGVATSALPAVTQLDLFDDWSGSEHGDLLLTTRELAATAAARDLKAVEDIYLQCDRARSTGIHITRVSKEDKEFHVQNWFEARLNECGLTYYDHERNTYPDFRLRRHRLGIEVKGMAHPGRRADYDSNSQLPSGNHDSREIYYFFGRYPADVGDRDTYPVTDLILCHGSFLNPDGGYLHKNSSIPGFGAYGDISIRVRKMYVVPNPFSTTAAIHTEGTTTLILPSETKPTADELVHVGDLTRIEADTIITRFEATVGGDQPMIVHTEPNPAAGREHRFSAYRARQAATRQEVL